MISGHGDDGFSLKTLLRADFSSNVRSEGTPPELLSHLQQNLHLISHYPEPDAASFCQSVADFHSVNSSQVLAFNGSVEAFYTIALAFRGSGSAILAPSFSEYEDACRMHSHQPVFFPYPEIQATAGAENLCWIGNPNNPDGHFFSSEEITDFLQTNQETILVVDEAYADFIPDFQSTISLTRKYKNLIVVRSLTKCCAIPGLRLGYVVASNRLASHLRKFMQPWSVNALAQEAGKFLISYLAKNPLQSNNIQQLSRQLQEQINRLENYLVIDSPAPFFLIEIKSGTAAQMKEFLINQHGILIRDASNFRGLNDQFFRICTQNETYNQLLINGLIDYTQLNC